MNEKELRNHVLEFFKKRGRQTGEFYEWFDEEYGPETVSWVDKRAMIHACRATGLLVRTGYASSTRYKTTTLGRKVLRIDS